jgi:polysaccharide biosynthesis/export protein
MNLPLLATIPAETDATRPIASPPATNPERARTGRAASIGAALAAGLLLAVLAAGCASSAPNAPYVADSRPPTVSSLREGDVLQIVFPGATNLNAVQKISPDGDITLQFAGQIKAAGRTPQELQDDILKSVGANLQLKEVAVTVVSTSSAAYVGGAVLRPGKLTLERPMTALEAIMESGGFDLTRAKTDQVVVIRYERGRQLTYRLNLKRALQGHETTPFYLQPSDVVYVPAKTWNL